MKYVGADLEKTYVDICYIAMIADALSPADVEMFSRGAVPAFGEDLKSSSHLIPGMLVWLPSWDK